MILEHCSRASCVQIIEALRDRVAELTAVLEERDDMILSQAEGLAALTKERSEPVAWALVQYDEVCGLSEVETEECDTPLFTHPSFEQCSEGLNASEAVYGFAAWLTSREQKTVMSSSDDSAPIAELVKQFCEENDLPEVSSQWPSNLIHPNAAPQDKDLVTEYSGAECPVGAAPSNAPAAANWTEDFAHENGNYQCLCSRCGKVFVGYKRRQVCKLCAAPLPDEVKDIVERLRGPIVHPIKFCMEAADEIERLRSLLQNGSPVVEGTIQHMAMQLAACQKDAERYRWLIGGQFVCDRIKSTYSTWCGCDGTDGFTKTLDAAMKQEGE